MNQHTTIKLLTSSGQISEHALEYGFDPPWFVELHLNGLPQARFEGGDLFDAVCKVRIQLETLGIRMLCNGSRVDAYPSRMARDMGGAASLYLLTKGEQARIDNLVAIFDEAPVETIGTVEDQRSYYSDWLSSLR